MKNIDKFAKGEMSEAQEKEYLETLYNKHYDTKLKDKYAEKLEEKYNITRENKEPATKKKSIIRSITLLASSIAALFIIGYFLLPIATNSKSIDPLIFASNQIVINDINVKRGESVASEMIEQATNSFNQKDYNEAILIFNKMEDKDSEILYYLSQAYMATSQYDKALFTMNEIDASMSFKYIEEMKWSKALALVLSENYIDALPLLEEISKGSWKKAEATELLKSINNK